MFSSSSFEKSSLGPDNSSPGRNNLTNRFPVGIPSSPDENQQIRIQLAVHKYNNSGNSPLNNGRTSFSPVVHSFLKNSLKVKHYERNAETSLKNDNKSANQYEGVGAFPTIHLKKSSVRYRPIRRFNQVKVPYPELPVNRFLSHLPELCPDMKSSTRSVLDVLQDLSGKKIHSKDDEDCNKPRSKGLGGDYYLDPNAAYKPLFVQKPKINAVTTKDNTTQTLLTHSTDTPSPKCSSSTSISDSSDPRAELRRKLARQNNEIFASLSSSITSSFALKRKIDKVLPDRDGDSTDGSAVKKSKILDTSRTNSEEDGISKVVKNGNMNSNETGKLNRKSKLPESSAISPNKDRLTTIFLDMRETSPKSQVFQNNSSSTEIKNTVEDSGQKIPVSTGTSSEITNNKSILLNGSSETSIGTSGAEGKNGINSNFNNNKPPASVTKPETEQQSSKPMFNFPISSAASSTTASTVSQSTFQFGVNTSNSTFTFPKTSSQTGNGLLTGGLPSTITSAPPIHIGVSNEKRDENDKTAAKTFTFGSTNDSEIKKPNFSHFKFGIDGNSSTTPNADISKPPVTESTTVSTTTVAATSTTNSIPIPQFSFGTKSNGTAPITGGIQFGQPITTNISGSQTTLISPVKPAFTFGQSSAVSQNKNDQTRKIDAATSVASTPNLVGQGIPSTGLFSFGSKPAPTPALAPASASAPAPAPAPTLAPASAPAPAPALAPASPATLVEPPKNEVKLPTTIAGPNPSTTTPSVSSTQNTTASTTPTVSSQTNIFGTNSTPACGLKTGTNSLFTFGQKSEVSAASIAVTAAQESKPAFTFTFGQKTDSTQNKPPDSVFGQKNSPNIFTSGQKPADSTPNAVPTSHADATQNNSQNLLKPQPTSNPSLIFGQNSSGSTLPAFGQTPTTNAFGAKPDSVTFGQVSAPAFGQAGSAFSNKPPLFGSATTSQPATGFGTSTTTTTGFGTSTSSMTFGVSTTQSTPAFGAPASTQSIGGFGASASTQPTSGFGGTSSTPSTLGFGSGQGQSPTAFGTSGFGTTPSTQSNLGFGVPAATQSTSGFGIGSTSQSFAQTFNNKPTTSLGQTPSIFDSTTINQNPVSNTGFGSTINTGQNNVFGQKTNADGGIFGQPNKIQTPSFGQNATSQSFGTPNKFGFGMSTSNSTSFTASPPNTTTSGIFNFGGSSTGQGSTFNFGSNPSSSANTQSPFTFKGATNETFKFGASSAKEGTGFGGNNRTFSFGGQMNETMGEAKPPDGVFNFGSNQVSSSGSGFNFGTTPSPSVFSFGGSGSSGSSGSSFNFGTPQPGAPFGQSANPSPGTPFAVPGMFRIGSGSTQSRPRASSRPRRRP